MPFYYFYVFVMLVLATPLVFSSAAEGRRPDDLVPALRPGDAGRALRRRRGRAAARARASRSRSSRRRRSATSGSPTARASWATCGARRGWRLLVPAMLGSFARAARRAARDADLVHAHWLPVGRGRADDRASRSSCSSGGPTSSSRGGRRRSPGACSRGRGSSICASNALAEAARELGAREVRVIPSGVDAARGRWASRPSRRRCSSSGGSRRRRASSSSCRRPTG